MIEGILNLKENKMNLKDKIAKMEQELAELKAKCNEQEVEYPLFRKSKYSGGIIVKFTGPNKDTVVWKSIGIHTIGSTTNSWACHTDTDHWEEVAYDKDRDLWDGQPVLCWDDADTHMRILRFYDAVNKCVYVYDGERDYDYNYDNIKAVNPDHYEDWMIKAHRTLEK